jgi:hypothetical protein
MAESAFLPEYSNISVGGCTVDSGIFRRIKNATPLMAVSKIKGLHIVFRCPQAL